MKIIGLKNCDKCRAAKKDLSALGFDVVLVDLREAPLSADQIADVISTFGEKALNTRSTTWRGLDETERAHAPADLLAAHPTLMKRPLIVDGDEMRLGWDAAQLAYFKDKA